jgi:hypothetical protein
VAGSDTGGQPRRPAQARAGLLGRSRGLAARDPSAGTPGGQEPYELNAKIVVVLIVAPALSSVDGKFGWLGEFGKCWVSNV